MGKQGPCYHCGVTSTPLWRNGPPEKPVLCNACGSRWRTKGTLTNYTPLHARAEAEEHEDHRLSKVKTVSPKIGEEKLKKRKLSYGYNHGFLESIDEEDTSNGSSSGSAVSNSECLFNLAVLILQQLGTVPLLILNKGGFPLLLQDIRLNIRHS